MSVTFHVDGSEVESVAEVHALLKSLRIKQADYYTKHYPRVCRGTGEPIPYKDHTQYFAQDFRDKAALEKWAYANPAEGKAWGIEWLRKRKEEKGLVYAPSQVELRSLTCPSREFYDSVGGYYAICKDLGFADRYTIRTPKFTLLPEKTRVICDTREQLPLALRLPTDRTKLEWGDYALTPDTNIHVERKSLADMIGTLTSKRVKHKRIAEDSPCERFERELIRAKEANGYIVMIVEAPIEQALSFRELTDIKHGKASATHIMKNLRDLLVKYPLTWQVVFVRDHADAAAKLIRIFEMGDQVKKTDLQYALERGVL